MRTLHKRVLAGAPAGANAGKAKGHSRMGRGLLGNWRSRAPGEQPFQVALLFAVAIHTAKEQWLWIIFQKKNEKKKQNHAIRQLQCTEKNDQIVAKNWD